MRTNCPNCSAPIDGDKCPYCGTRLINIADLEIGKPVWLIFKDRHRNVTHGQRIVINHIDVVTRQSTGDIACFADNTPFYWCSNSPEIDISISGTLTPNEKGVLGIRVDMDVAEDPEVRHYI